jgi:hypothetical protein
MKAFQHEGPSCRRSAAANVNWLAGSGLLPNLVGCHLQAALPCPFCYPRALVALVFSVPVEVCGFFRWMLRDRQLLSKDTLAPLMFGSVYILAKYLACLEVAERSSEHMQPSWKCRSGEMCQRMQLFGC